MNPIEARKRIVQTYQRTQNYCETARRCHTSPQRVRKWVQRDQQDGEAGLADQPRTPKRQPRKTDPAKQAWAATPPKDPLWTPTPRPPTRPARHPAVSPHHPPHPPTPRQSHSPPAPTATPPLSGTRGVGNAGTVHAHSSRWEGHLRQGHARYGTLGSLAQASPPPLSVDFP
jgi:hypothetical protein